MKFNCGLSQQERHEAKKEWHLWFAWWPVRVASCDCRWLEWVERKGTWRSWQMVFMWAWEYRKPVIDAAPRQE